MNRFHIVKTVHLILLILLTVGALLTVFLNEEVYSAIAADAGVRTLAIFLWIVLGVSFIFLYFDFYSYTGLKRENTELDHAIYADALTGIANRYSMDVYIGQFQGKPLPEDMGCVTLELTNLAQINQHLGHSGGDEAIQAFSELLQSASSASCVIGRNGGDKFLAIFRNCRREQMEAFLDQLSQEVNQYNVHYPDRSLQYCTGMAFEEGDRVSTLTELVALSDRRAWKMREQRNG